MLAEESISPAVQDYVKAVYVLETRSDHRAVSTNALAERLGVSAASASLMVRRLAETGLAEHEPYRGVRLTPKGRKVALEVLRHHRLLELFLAEELGMPWDRVHDEAERLEHVISEELEERIATRLGHPEVDPHGDPIPSATLELQEQATRSLESLEPGAAGCFVRVSDSDPAMLRYLHEQGIAPGDRFAVVDRQPFGGPLMIRFGDSTHAIGGELARAMRVVADAGEAQR